MAQVYVNSFWSEDFQLSKGTRQGCPLFPIIFPISLEPLAAVIRNNPNILGVVIDSHMFKLNLFADDTVVYLRNPLCSLPHVISEFEAFGHISGFSINQSKSEFYPVAIPDSMKHRLQSQFRFWWVQSTWHHLGIHVPVDLKDLFSVNYTPLLAKVRSLIHVVGKLNLSLGFNVLNW